MELNEEEINQAIDIEINAGVEQFGLRFKIAIFNILNLERMKKVEAVRNLEKNIEAAATTIEQKVVNIAKEKTLIELSKWNKYRNYPTVGALRQLYHRREENGFEVCIVRGGPNGGRILIDPEKFDQWQEKRKKKNND